MGYHRDELEGDKDSEETQSRKIMQIVSIWPDCTNVVYRGESSLYTLKMILIT